MIVLMAASAVGHAQALYVCRLDGSDKVRLAGEARAAWFPGGEQLLLGGVDGLYRVNRDGSGKKRLLKEPGLHGVDQLMVSASGRYAAGFIVHGIASSRLLVWDLQEGRRVVEHPVRDATEYAHTLLAWHPTRDLVASAEGPLAVVDAARGGVTQPACSAEFTDGITWRGPLDRILVADGGRLLEVTASAMDRLSSILAAAGENGERLLEAAEATEVVLPVRLPHVNAEGVNGALRWLHEAEVLYCDAYSDSEGGARFCTLEDETVEPVLPPATHEHDNEWRCVWAAPDGSDVILERTRLTENWEPVRHYFRGALRQPLAEFRPIEVAATGTFSPDGQWVAYVSHD